MSIVAILSLIFQYLRLPVSDPHSEPRKLCKIWGILPPKTLGEKVEVLDGFTNLFLSVKKRPPYYDHPKCGDIMWGSWRGIILG